MISCDICGAEESRYALNELKPDFQVDGIKDVCSKCLGEIENIVKPVHSRALTATMNIWHRAGRAAVRRLKTR